jgi:hypothetical protein
MDANKIKFVDDDGTVEVLEPPMTARIHVETPTRPETPDLEGIQEEEREDHLLMKDEVVEIISSSVKEQVTVKNEVEDAASSVEDAVCSVEDAVEQHVKEIEKMDNVLLAASQPPSAPFSEREQGTPDVIKMDEVKVPEEIDNEALSLVANAVQHASEHKPITPKGCCILQ